MAPVNHLPLDADKRKDIPLYSGLIRYFPDALVEIARLSKIGTEQHNPGAPLFWDRSKSGDEHDALMRHLLEAGTVDTDGVRHSTKVAWRALAALQKEIEGTKTVGQCEARYKDCASGGLLRCAKENGHDGDHRSGGSVALTWPKAAGPDFLGTICCGDPRTCADPCADGRNE